MPATSPALDELFICFCGGKHLLMQKQELALCGVNLKRFGFASFDSGDPKYCFIDLKRQWLLQNVLKMS